MSDESPELLAAIATARDAMKDQPVDTAPPAPVIPAGRIVAIYARWVPDKGPAACVGIYQAKRDFDPVEEHRLFSAQFPDYGDPVTWTERDRHDWAAWAVGARGFLEPYEPAYIFMEPIPMQATAAAEKVPDAG